MQNKEEKKMCVREFGGLFSGLFFGVGRLNLCLVGIGTIGLKIDGFSVYFIILRRVFGTRTSGRTGRRECTQYSYMYFIHLISKSSYCVYMCACR